MAFYALFAPIVWASETCTTPIDQHCSVSSGSHQDPHLHFAHGGSADFRGEDGKYYALLSAPGIHFAARTRESDFILPNGPLLVHGTFFTEIAFVMRGKSGRIYGVKSDASAVGFDVYDLGLSNKFSSDPDLIVKKHGIWTDWHNEDVSVTYKQSTLVVRSNGWEANSTRNHIYNHISGVSRWRFDLAMRTLSGTGLESKYGATSKTCYAHGVIGQSYDGDDVAVDGKKDNYTVDALHPVFTTNAQAEGAIEGEARDYCTSSAFNTQFRFSRFHSNPEDVCAPRDVSSLKGKKRKKDGAAKVGSML